MKTFADRLREDRRLVILRLLSEASGYRANSSVLHAGLQYLAIAASRDDVLTDLAWLQDQGLVRLDQVTDSIQTVTLSARGDDVAHGRAIVPGVSRPSPR
jgi:hypothetical protein